MGVLPTAPRAPERWLSLSVLGLIAFALAFRLPMLVKARLGSDEVSQFHTAWAVAQGQVPYGTSGSCTPHCSTTSWPRSSR